MHVGSPNAAGSTNVGILGAPPEPDYGNGLKTPSRGRAINTYDMPPGMDAGIQSVGLVELTGDEEIMATKRAHGDHMRLGLELAKQSLVAVNGAKVSLADGSTDRAWETMGPKLRNMVLTAYAELHSAPDEAIQSFLKSRRTRVG